MLVECKDFADMSEEELIKHAIGVKAQIDRLKTVLEVAKTELSNRAEVKKAAESIESNTVNFQTGPVSAKVVFKTNLVLNQRGKKLDPTVLTEFCRVNWKIDAAAYKHMKNSGTPAERQMLSLCVEEKVAKPSVSFESVLEDE